MIHRVRQGEHLAKIAERYGLPFDRIWEHPENAELRERRKNPNVLEPGDRLFIPEPKRRTESIATEQRHRFRVKREKLWLRLDVRELLGRDLAGAPCQLHLGAECRELTVSSEGLVETTVPAGLDQAVLVIEGLSYPVRIGDLDPVEQVSGQRERLRNLGFLAGDSDSEDEAALADAVKRFQREHGLDESGTCDDATRAKLADVHGA